MWEFEDYSAEAADDDPEVLAGLQRLRLLRADEHVIVDITARVAKVAFAI